MSYMKRHIEETQELAHATKRLKEVIEEQHVRWEESGKAEDYEWYNGKMNGLLTALNILSNSEAL